MANRYVRAGAGGANDGTDWTNAFTAFPAMASITRGDTIYVADGSYAAVTFNKAGTIRVMHADDTVVTDYPVTVAGYVYPWAVRQVHNSGTSASSIVAQF